MNRDELRSDLLLIENWQNGHVLHVPTHAIARVAAYAAAMLPAGTLAQDSDRHAEMTGWDNFFSERADIQKALEPYRFGTRANDPEDWAVYYAEHDSQLSGVIRHGFETELEARQWALLALTDHEPPF